MNNATLSERAITRGFVLAGAVNVFGMLVVSKLFTNSAARANLATTMDRVCNDHEALIITRNGERSVVMLSLEDFQALEETAYLLRNPANAKRLLAATEQLSAGKGVARQLAK